MEILLMVILILLQALCLRQGIHGAVISSNENGSIINRSDELEKNWHTGSNPYNIYRNCPETLLAHHHGRWVAFTLPQKRDETNEEMSRLCKNLYCGRLFAENVSSSMKICLSDCTIINSNLYNCTEAAPDNCSNMVDVICVWQMVRLVGGNDRCAGRVELFGTEGWGSVCDDGWDFQGGNVVCAQLGCGTAVKVMGEAGDFEAGSGPIHINELNCSGTERNLWQCATETDKDKNYCGHKEDASVVCSGSSYIPVTTMNTIMRPNVTNWTIEIAAEAAAENMAGVISLPFLGCIVLSVALLLLLLLNAAQCAYYKRQNGGSEVRRASQASQQASETLNDSDYEHYTLDPLSHTTVNNVLHTHTVDSESTSSGECYEKTEMQNLLNPVFKQLNPEYCRQTAPLHNTSKAAKNALDSFDSDSTSSGECYENMTVNAESCLHTYSAVPEQPTTNTTTCHLKHQLVENNSISQSYNCKQAQALDSDSTSSGEYYENTKPESSTQMSTLNNAEEPDNSAQDSVNAENKSCESYKNTETETFLHTVEEDPALPVQPTPQLAENRKVSQTSFTDLDDNSTSSEDPYENVTEPENYFGKSDPSVHSSTDNDYNDVGNW